MSHKQISDNMVSIQRPTGTNDVVIVFVSGEERTYHGISDNVFNKFMTAEYIDDFFDMYIRDGYIFS